MPAANAHTLSETRAMRGHDEAQEQHLQGQLACAAVHELRQGSGRGDRIIFGLVTPTTKPSLSTLRLCLGTVPVGSWPSAGGAGGRLRMACTPR